MRHLTPTLALAIFFPSVVAANDPPEIDHQQAVCTVPENPLSLCAAISDDGVVSAARLYFRKPGDKYFAFVDMTFSGVSYCAIVPAPRQKTKAVEYYLQATDDGYETKRTSTYLIQVQAACDFPPIEKDPAKAAAIKVFATHAKQGRKLSDAFVATGVQFVAAGR
jgi:hypothetical protein